MNRLMGSVLIPDTTVVMRKRQYIFNCLQLWRQLTKQTLFHIIFTLGHHVFPKTHIEVVHTDAVPCAPQEENKSAHSFLK